MLLPILIFEAGFALDVHTFKKSFINAFCLATGIVTATVMTGVAFWGLIQVFGGWCLCFRMEYGGWRIHMVSVDAGAVVS